MNNTTNFMQLFMALQDMSGSNLSIAEQVKRKERIVFATPHIIKPNDWETLSDEEKLKRLNKVQNA